MAAVGKDSRLDRCGAFPGKASEPRPASTSSLFVSVEGHIWMSRRRPSLTLGDETRLVYLPSVCCLCESKLKWGSNQLSPMLLVREKGLGGEGAASHLCKSKQRTCPCPRWGAGEPAFIPSPNTSLWLHRSLFVAPSWRSIATSLAPSLCLHRHILLEPRRSSFSRPTCLPWKHPGIPAERVHLHRSTPVSIKEVPLASLGRCLFPSRAPRRAAAMMDLSLAVKGIDSGGSADILGSSIIFSVQSSPIR